MNPEETFGADIDLDAAVTDPVALLRQWLARCDGTVTALMTLSTIGLDGYPNSRQVVLSRCDEEGRILFHTDSRSRKAAELAAIPRASVTLAWPTLARQLVVAGEVVVQDSAGQADAYARRPRYLQLLAWLNDVEAARLPVAERRAAWAAYDAAHRELEPPRTWIGYALIPKSIALWRGEPDAPSNRLLCERSDAGWSVERRPG